MHYRFAASSFALVIAAVLATLSVANHSAADTPSTAHTANRLQLSLGVPIARVHAAFTNAADNEASHVSAQIGGIGGYGPGLVPALGFGIGDGWLLEVALSYWRTSNSAGDDFQSRTSEFNIAPGLAHVFAAGQALRPFVGARVELGRRHSTWSSGSEPIRSTAWTVGGSVRAGVQLHIAEHLSLDPYGAIHYAHVDRDEAPAAGGLGALAGQLGTAENTIGLEGGVALSVWL